MQQPDVDQLASIMAEAIDAAVAPLLALNKDLTARLHALESLQPIAGPMGPQGQMGPAGPQGIAGPAGANGEVGAPGARGEAGPPGEVGPRGAMGPAGPQGERGPQGEKGEPGVPGERGAEGPQGIAGRDGLPGVQGPHGEKGVDGKAGIDGAHGKDGRDGTLENLKVVQQDERTLAFCFKDGTPIDGGIVTFSHPVFKGTYAEAGDYQKNDIVQWSGGGWIAVIDHPPLKPGAGSPEATGWRLFIKPGRDGKDGKPGINGKDGKIVEVKKDPGKW